MKKYDKYKKPRRITVTEWVDIDTGEFISKSEKQENYRIINSTERYETKYTNNEEYIIKTITRECRHKGQIKLQL